MPTAHVLPVARLYEEFYNQPDLSIAMQIVPSILLSPERVIEDYRALRIAFPDWSVIRDLTLPSGRYVTVRWTGRGTHQGVLELPQVRIPPTGIAVVVLGISLYEVDKGKIVGSIHATDGLDLLAQLGVGFAATEDPPPPSSPPRPGSRPSRRPRS